MRVKLTIEYDGTNYAGWQRQENALAVQQVVEEALFRLTGKPHSITGASRTDAGVHAFGQVAHFDAQSRIPAEKYAYALNTVLPADVRIRDSRAVAEDFHARFSAKGKWYCYSIFNDAHASAILRNTHAHVMYPLDVDAMRREAQCAVGRHDFRAFAASGSVVKDTVRTIHSIEIARQGKCVSMQVRGNGFLYNMVRILAGTLIGVGTGKLEGGAVRRALASGSRLDLGVTAPACGLTLMEVFYDA